MHSSKELPCSDLRRVYPPELTTALQSLRMQNVPNECELRLELPALREVSIHFLGL